MIDRSRAIRFARDITVRLRASTETAPGSDSDLAPRARGRTIALTAAVAVALVAGTAIRSPYPFAIAIPLIFYAGASIQQRRGGVSVEAERTVSARRIDAGEEVTVALTARFSSPSGYISFRDVLPSGAELIEGETEYRGPIPETGAIALSYRVRLGRGVHRFADPAIVHVGGRLMWTRSMVAPAHALVTAVPRVAVRGHFPIRPPSTNLYPGAIRSGRAGSGTDFFDVREYRSGDPLRHVNWKASSFGPGRTPQLVINEYEEERATDIGLILDVRAGVYPRGRVDGAAEAGIASYDTLFGRAVVAAAALAELFTANGNRVGLLLYGGPLRWSDPGYGKYKRERMLDRLAGARLEEHGAFGELGRIPLNLFRRGTQLALISPLIPEDADDLIRLRARGYRVLVFRPDPISWEERMLPHSPYLERAARIARMEYACAKERLERNAVFVAEWDAESELTTAIASESRRFAGWRRFR